MDTDYGVPMEVDRIRARVSKVMETQAGSEEVQTWVSVFTVSDEASSAAGVHTLPATFGILPDDSDLNREIVIELEALANGSDRGSSLSPGQDWVRQRRSPAGSDSVVPRLCGRGLSHRGDLWLRWRTVLHRPLLH